MLSRITVHRFGALSLFRCRSSIALRRPIITRHFAPSTPCSHRRRHLSDSPAATAAAAAKDNRRWVMLSSYGRYCPEDSSSFVADAITAAESRTSEGRRVRVSLRCAAPPSSSYLYYDFPESSYHHNDEDSIRVVAAHGELLHLEMRQRRPYYPFGFVDHFVYRPAGPCRPPSLSLLPVPDFPESVSASYVDSPTIRRPRLGDGGIGLLRRGESENDLLVVHVHVDWWYYDCNSRYEIAVFCVLRLGNNGMRRQWELMDPMPVQNGPGLLWSPSRDVICVGDRFLCWLWNSEGFLLCDMADEASPRRKVRHVHLPPEAVRCSYGNDINKPLKFRRMGAAGDDSSVRFVSIHPHCCSVELDDDDPVCCGCGGDFDDRSKCWHPQFVFTIKTWKMNLLGMDEDQPLEWVEDGEIDAEEIWALPGYEGLPQAFPEWPVLCLDKPNVVCFLVSNYHFTRDAEKVWMVQLNINTKTLLSVVQLTSNDDDFPYWKKYHHLPAEIQY